MLKTAHIVTSSHATDDTAEIFAAHNRSTHRDDILVVATWFRMREKDIFTPTDVEPALGRLGRPISAKNVQEVLSSVIHEHDEVARAAYGLYRVSAAGIARAKRLLISAEAADNGRSVAADGKPSS